MSIDVTNIKWDENTSYTDMIKVYHIPVSNYYIVSHTHAPLLCVIKK